jgi:folate-binding protein YgfZ
MDLSPLLARHQAHGARLAARPEAPEFTAPLVFAGVPGEYRAGREGCALFDACDRGRVSVGGKDAGEFLHRLLANHVKSLALGEGNANLLLTPKGKVAFAFELARRAEGYELSTAPGRAPALAQALERYHFSENLRIADTSAEHAPLELSGPGAGALASELAKGSNELEPGRWRAVPWQGGELFVQGLGHERLRLDAGRERVAALWDALVTAGATPAGLVARDSLRVEACRALPGVDVDENVYPQEAGLDAAFALDKGCYVGQEVVAKNDTYGGLNKRLLTLTIDHSDPVPRGTKLLREEDGERRELGLATSWAYSFALDKGLVLAYVKRGHQEPGTSFELEERRGRATLVVPPAR